MRQQKNRTKSVSDIRRGQKLRQVRLDAGFRKQAEFGKFLGPAWTQDMISRYESGMTPVPTDLLDALASKLPNISMDWLLLGRGAIDVGMQAQEGDKLLHAIRRLSPRHRDVVLGFIQGLVAEGAESEPSSPEAAARKVGGAADRAGHGRRRKGGA
jgi:hypothetical protein